MNGSAAEPAARHWGEMREAAISILRLWLMDLFDIRTQITLPTGTLRPPYYTELIYIYSEVSSLKYWIYWLQFRTCRPQLLQNRVQIDIYSAHIKSTPLPDNSKRYGLTPSAFIGQCGSLRLERIIIVEKVQLVRNLSNPIRFWEFIWCPRAAYTRPRGHRVRRGFMYLVRFWVNVSGLRCTGRVCANRYNSPGTVFRLGVNQCPGDNGGSFAIYQHNWGVLENTCVGSECCHASMPDVVGRNVDAT